MYQGRRPTSQPCMPSSEYPHPLTHDTQVIDCDVVNSVHQTRPDESLRSIVLERGPAAELAWEEYVAARETGVADKILLKSLLATADLHRRGMVTAMDEAKHLLDEDDLALHDVATAPYDMKDELVATYGLTPVQVLAVEAYSNANKSLAVLPGEPDPVPNPHFMGQADHWGGYTDGWGALAAALARIPTLGQLGLTLTTYRAARAPKDPDEVTEIKPDRGPGGGDEQPPGTAMTPWTWASGTPRSTAVTYNPHWERGPGAGGLIAVTGNAGHYINPFGLQGWVDGAEVLYPPGLWTAFEGLNPRAYRVQFPVAHLRQVAEPETGQARTDDSRYAVDPPRERHSTPTRQKIIDYLSADPSRAAKVPGALRTAGPGREGPDVPDYRRAGYVAHVRQLSRRCRADRKGEPALRRARRGG